MAAQQQRIDGEDATEALQAMHDEPALIAFAVREEPLVRQLVATVLRRTGWSLFEAEDGSIALSVAPASLYQGMIPQSPRPARQPGGQVAAPRLGRQAGRPTALSARR